MGNTSPSPRREHDFGTHDIDSTGRQIELLLSKPQATQLDDGASQILFARAGSLSSTFVKDVPWDEATIVNLNGDDDSIVLNIFMADSFEAYGRGEGQLCAEAVIPSCGSCGLEELGVSPGGPSVDFRMRLTRAGIPSPRCGSPFFQEFLTTLAIRAREVGVAGARPNICPQPAFSLAASLNSLGSAEFGPSASARQLLKLELENAVLRKQVGAMEDHSKPIHIRHLQMVQQDTAAILSGIREVESRIEKIKAAQADVARGGQTPNPAANPQFWGRTLDMMSKELELSQKRQHEIRRNYENHSRGLESMLQQARLQIDRTQVLKASSSGSGRKVSPQVAEVGAEIGQATKLRNELQRQLNQIREDANKRNQVVSSADAKAECGEIRQLRMAIDQCGDQLEALKKDMSLKHSQHFASGRRQRSSSQVQRLQDDIEEHRQLVTDLRVRAESELQEIKTHCDSVKDCLDAFVAELQLIRERAKALSNIGGATCASVQDVERLRAELKQQKSDYNNLKAKEQARMTTMQDMEKELEQLEELARRGFRSCQGHSPCNDMLVSPNGRNGAACGRGAEAVHRVRLVALVESGPTGSGGARGGNGDQLARQLDEEKRLLQQQEEGLKSLQERVNGFQMPENRSGDGQL